MNKVILMQYNSMLDEETVDVLSAIKGRKVYRDELWRGSIWRKKDILEGEYGIPRTDEDLISMVERAGNTTDDHLYVVEIPEGKEFIIFSDYDEGSYREEIIYKEDFNWLKF